MFAYMFLAYIVFGGVFKLGLIVRWSKRLHDKHPTRYSFSEIFRMMFWPQFQSNFDADFWNDFAPIQKWNALSNIILVGGAFLFMLVGTVVGGLMR